MDKETGINLVNQIYEIIKNREWYHGYREYWCKGGDLDIPEDELETDFCKECDLNHVCKPEVKVIATYGFEFWGRTFVEYGGGAVYYDYEKNKVILDLDIGHDTAQFEVENLAEAEPYIKSYVK